MVFIGPNRRSDRTVIEQHLALSAREIAGFERNWDHVQREAARILKGCTKTQRNHLPVGYQSTSPVHRLAGLYCRLAIALQRATGHTVSEYAVRPRDNPRQCEIHFEYEQVEVGARSGELALHLLQGIRPELEWTGRFFDPSRPFIELYEEFARFSSRRVLPGDTLAICNAAIGRDIPCVKLDRPPYRGVGGDFRIRKNGLLKLGDCRFQHIVDGTLCVDRSGDVVDLVFDRRALLNRLVQLCLSLPRHASNLRACLTLEDAARVADEIGYPVVVKPAKRTSTGVTPDVGNVHDLEEAIARVRASSHEFMIEQHIRGDTYRIIVANHEAIGIVAASNGNDVLAHMHPSTLALGTGLSREFRVGMAVVTVVTPDIARPLEEAGGAVVDLELAPELDGFLAPGSELLDRAADQFVKWLYPDGSPSRIPVISVTGTNGKTTTCRMIDHIMRIAGHTTSLVSTDGFYVNGQLVERAGEQSTSVIFRQFESPELNCAIVENHFGRIVRSGYAYFRCDIAVCTNVSADHLGRAGIDTVEQMAAAKRSMLERARQAVVLNADNDHCLDMVPYFPSGKVCLVSMQAGAETLAGGHREAGCFCVIETIDGIDWIVWHRDSGRKPVIPVGRIPATFDGKAKYNVSNSLQAIAAACLLDVDFDAIRSAMGSFAASYGMSPGRLNFFTRLPYTVVLDYAHNPAAVSSLCAFIDELSIPGKKLLVLDVPANRSSEAIRNTARAAAGFFDRYYCKNFDTEQRGDQEVPQLIREALVEGGVDARRIRTFPGPGSMEAGLQALSEAGRGDLVVILAGYQERTTLWSHLEELASAHSRTGVIRMDAR